MPASVEVFLAAFPEFLKAGEPMIAAHMALAAFEVSDSFGSSRDLALYLRLADMLALSPFGRNARLVSDKATTSTYGVRFQAMAEANGISPSRMGSSGFVASGSYGAGVDGVNGYGVNGAIPYPHPLGSVRYYWGWPYSGTPGGDE